MTCPHWRTRARLGRCELESGLAVPMVRCIEQPVARPTGRESLVNMMARIQAVQLVVAIDGGAKDGCTSIGLVATAHTSTPANEPRLEKMHESVGGADTTSYIGELEAVARTLQAAKRAGKRLILVVDNRSVVDLLRSLLEDRFDLPKFAWRQWLDVEEAVEGIQHKVLWCPSHGKHAGKWKTGMAEVEDAWLRHLNDIADEEATAGLEKDKRKRRLEAQWAENGIADEWAEKMLTRQYQGFEQLCESYQLEEKLTGLFSTDTHF